MSAPETRFAVLLFTDIVGSTELKARHGVPAYSEALRAHNAHFERIARECHLRILSNAGDSYFAEAGSVTEAVRLALLFQDAMRDGPWSEVRLTARVGIHAGEFTVVDSEGGSGVVGPAADLAARVMSLAIGGQILLTQVPFDEARCFVREHPPVAGKTMPPLRWPAHGPYLMKGREEPLQIFEVGAEDLAPLTAPPDGDKAKRAIRPGEEETLGWRPAVGLEIPGRTGWHLTEKLGAGGFGEVWVGEHAKLHQRRAFKFCFDDERLRALKREVTLVRLLRSALGERDDIVHIHELKLDAPPFYLESDLAPHGNLLQWAESQGGLDKIPLAQRIALVAHTATALAAAHSIGVLHKDIKPTNILIFDGPGGEPRPRLVDFGIGTLADPAVLGRHGVTAAGFTRATIQHSTGTPTYSPPEYLAGKPYTTQGDIYGLGVLLYQLVTVKPLDPLAPGWERDIPDPLLREDIAACVDGDPARRLPSAADLAERLTSIEERRSELTRRQNEEAAIREQQTNRERLRRTRRLVALSAAIAAFAIVALAITALSLSRAKRAEKDAKTQSQNASIARADAEKQRDQTRTTAAQASYDLARIYFSQIAGGYHTGLAHMARALRSQPTHAATIQALFEALPEKSWMVPVSPPLPHQAAVDHIEFSADGKRLATLAGARLRVWDVATSRTILGPLENYGARNIAGRMSRDGRKLLSNKNGSALFQLWDIETKKAIGAPFKAYNSYRDHLPAFSPDGRTMLFVVSGEDSSRTQTRIPWLLDTQSGERKAIQSSSLLEISEVAAAPDGSSWIILGQTMRDEKAPEGEVIGSQRSCLLTIAADGTEKAFALINSKNRLSFSREAMLLPQWEGALIKSDVFSDGVIEWVSAATGAVTPFTVSERIPTERENYYTVRTHPNTEGLASLPSPLRCLAGLLVDRHGMTGSDKLPITIGERGSVAVWDSNSSPSKLTIQLDPDDSKTLATGRAERGINSEAEFIADGRRLVIFNGGDYRPAFQIYDAATAAATTPWISATGEVRFAKASSDGDFLATGHDNKTARLWRIHHVSQQKSAPSATTTTPAAKEDAIVFTTFSSDGSRFCLAYQNKTSRVFDTRTNQPLGPRIQHAADVRKAQISADGKRVLIAVSPRGEQAQGAVKTCAAQVWDIETGQPAGKPMEHTDSVRAARFDLTGTHVVTASKDKTARVWDATSGEPLTQAMEHDVDLLDAIFSPDGLLVATVASDNTARVWNAATGEPMTEPLAQTFSTSQDIRPDIFSLGEPVPNVVSVRAASFDADGKRLLTSGSGALVWRIDGDGNIGYTSIQDTGVQSARFSPTGGKILMTDDTGAALLWSTARGEETGPWTKVALPSRSPVSRVGFAAGGHFIVTIAQDGSVRIWDEESALPLSPPVPCEGCRAAEVMSDGKRFAVIDKSGRATVHEIPQNLEAAPPWFADFIEAMAAQRVRADGEMEATPQIPLEVLAPVRQAGEHSRYRQLAEWLLDFTEDRAARFEEQKY